MKVGPLRIGSLTIATPALLAPMAGFTTPPFRLMCQQLGAGLTFTEMAPAEGVRRRLRQTMAYLETLPEEYPVAAHIYGHDPDAFAAAAEIIDSLGRFALIDINCGCPVRKIAGRGEGVSLMRDPERIRAIVTTVRQSSSLPVTVKTRIGIDPDSCNISEVAQAIEESGADALFLHGRFATQRHSGPVDFEAISRIKRERTIPVIGNGGIASARQASEMIERTGVDGVMIGQGAIGNPWVFDEIRCEFEGTTYHPPSVAERKSVIARHLRGLCEVMAAKNELRKRPSAHVERLACQAFRVHLGRYLHGQRGIKLLQRNLMSLDSIEAVIAAAGDILEGHSPETTEMESQPAGYGS